MRHTYSPEFEAAWALFPKRHPDNPKPPAYRAWCARLKEGVSPELLTACVKEYAAYVRRASKEGTEFVLQGATFFGPNERWKAYEPKPEAPRPSVAPRKPIVEEERIDARPFLRELLAGLAKAKTSPVSNYVRGEK